MFDWLKKRKKDEKTVVDYKGNWRFQERWEDYPSPKYDEMHTYCSVVFSGSEKIFYYRTRNPQIKVGDLVYVPIGNEFEKKIARVVAMEEFLGSEAPYPLEKTKYIKGKIKNQ